MWKRCRTSAATSAFLLYNHRVMRQLRSLIISHTIESVEKTDMRVHKNVLL